MNLYEQSIANMVGDLDKYERFDLLKDLVQNMVERSLDNGNDPDEIARFIVQQLGGDAHEVVAGRLSRHNALLKRLNIKGPRARALEGARDQTKERTPTCRTSK